VFGVCVCPDGSAPRDAETSDADAPSVDPSDGGADVSAADLGMTIDSGAVLGVPDVVPSPSDAFSFDAPTDAAQTPDTALRDASEGGVDGATPDILGAVCPVGMIRVPAGMFPMGSRLTDIGASSNEVPQHIVALSAYCIDALEVTVEAYQVCVAAGRCLATSRSARCNSTLGFVSHPVNCVDWAQAARYCEQSGNRLPTEAEWERAARGDDGRTYPWGNTAPEDRVCWYDYPTSGTCEVGSFPSGASPHGLQDMAGNVAEWVSDWFDAYSTAPMTDPQGPTGGTARVIRGGGLVRDTPTSVRSAYRQSSSPVVSYTSVGFRCARSVR